VFPREKKTAPELLATITDEIRRYPQYNDVVNIVILPSQKGRSNWEVSYDIETTRSGSWPAYLGMEIDKLIGLFQDDFELI
jgi:hypothetical protein